jgi:hypothetical protein
MNKDRQYVGSGKEGKFGQVSIGLKFSDLVPNERGYVNLIVARRKESDKYGNTHTVYVNDWKPGQKKPEDEMSF